MKDKIQGIRKFQTSKTKTSNEVLTAKGNKG
jgi:hypothetical protein